MENFNIIKDSAELRKLIAENPELPIVVMIGREAACDEWYWTYCEGVHCVVDEVLDCVCPWEETRVYNDRIEFEEALADYLSGTVENADKMTDEEFERIFDEQKSIYSQYWHKAIIVIADN